METVDGVEFAARHADGAPVERLADIIRHRATLTPDAIALASPDVVVTFVELDRASSQVANGLLASDCRPGDRVVYLGGNSPQFLQVAFGAMKAGAVFTPLNTRLSVSEISEILADAEPRVVVIDEASAGLTDAVRVAVGPVALVLSGVGGPRDEFADWRDLSSAADPRRDLQAEDTVLIMFSSGTTGRPKGVMLSSRNLACGLYLMNQLVEMDERSVCSAPVPFFHVSGLGLALVSILNGARLLLERPGSVEELLAYLVQEQVSHANVVPTVLQALVDLPAAADADFSAFSFVLYGAAPMPVPLLERATELIGCKFLQSYGLTESTGGFTLLSPEDHVAGTDRPELLRSVGRIVPGSRVRVVDPKTLDDVPVGAHGEVLVSGPRVMNGYWRQPAETRAAILDGGWLRTGDGGSFDAEGYLYLHDRIKDMIVSGGENIYPAEVERALSAHPGVAECAVLSVASQRWGESPWAYVVRRDESSLTESSLTEPELIAWVRDRLAHYKCPVGVTFVDQLPRTATGKLQRARLRNGFAAAE